MHRDEDISRYFMGQAIVLTLTALAIMSSLNSCINAGGTT